MNDDKSRIRSFLLLIAVLFVLRIILSLMLLPAAVAAGLDLLVTALFIGLPIVAMFLVSGVNWTRQLGWIFLGIGGFLHLACGFLVAKVLPPVGMVSVVVQSVIQVGISLWTMGLGALVASMIKDKNLIVPVALFLAGLDMFFVFNPDAPTAKMIRQNPGVFKSLAYNVPSARANGPQEPQGTQIVARALVGPADLLFMATFFVLLSRYKMRVDETAKWLTPVMILYLLIVLSPLGLSMLPALVPIGATVLIVNRKEFDMTSEEKVMTGLALAFALALASFGLYRHFTYKPTASPIEPSNQPSVQGLPGSGSSSSQGQ